MDDETIIELFFARSEQAIIELDRKYGKTCYRLSYNILNNSQDAEECVNDAYLGTWNAIPPERPNPLVAFLWKIVRNLSIMRYHANTAQKRNCYYEVALDELEDCLASTHTVDMEIDEKELIRTIEEFLETLSEENRVVFMRRYWFSDSYEDIAKQVGISKNSVSVKLTRIRKQLQKYLKERGYEV